MSTSPTSLNESESIPQLRRASTFTLDEEDKDSKTTAKATRSLSKPTSLSKKSSSFVEKGALVTKLSGLKSGSIVGETTMAVDLTTGKTLPTKSSSKSSKRDIELPSIPSGLTKLAFTGDEDTLGSFRHIKSKLLTNVDETEMDSALASLKSTISKSKSVTGLPKSLSTSSKESSKIPPVKRTSTVKSSTSAKDQRESMVLAANGIDEDMDTSVAGSSSPTVDLPPGGLVEVAVSFDTTGSMYGCLEEVRAKIQDLVQRLQGDIPGT